MASAASSAAVAGGNEISIRMPAAAADPADELLGRESAAAKPEKRLNCFVRFVALGEWAGNAFGALAFLLATVVLLGGFCSELNGVDFWFATVMIFIEAFRIFSRNYTLDNHSLFGTARALGWIRSLSFARMLGQPQEGNEVVLIMGLCTALFDLLISTRTVKRLLLFFVQINNDDPLPWVTVVGTLKMLFLILMSKLQLRGAPQLMRRPRRRRQLLLGAVLIVFLSFAAYYLSNTRSGVYLGITIKHGDRESWSILFYYKDPSPFETLGNILPKVVAVLLLILRPRKIASLTSSYCGRKLLSLAKVVSALGLSSVLVLLSIFPPLGFLVNAIYFGPLSPLVLSLGSLQSPVNSMCGRWIDVVLHILFLRNLVFPSLIFASVFLGNPLAASLIIFLAALLITNLQIPTAVVQVVLSSLRLRSLLARHDYHPLPKGGSPNMVPAIVAFYVLALCQGSLYIMACVLGVFSFFPRRLLIRRSKFSGKRGAKAVDLYYQRAYATRMEIGVFAGGNNISFANFAIESLSSISSELQIAGVCVLDNIIQRRDYSEELITRVTNSSTALSTMISMLGWTTAEESNIRLFAARVTRELADRLRIDGIPGLVKLVSLLLDTVDNQTPGQESSAQISSDNAANQPTHDHSAQSNRGGCSRYWLCRYLQQTKQKWSVPNEPPLTHEDSFPVLGMEILEKLSCDPDNFSEIVKATNLISKIIGLISYTAGNERSNSAQQNAVIYSALKFVRHLAITGEQTLRQQLWQNPFLLNNLTCILDDSHSNPQLWEPAMHIIAKLALDEEASKEIGSTQMIIGKLMHAFLGKDRENNYYDQSLRLAAGEALANLAMENTANCLAILKEPAYHVIKDLKDLLHNYEYRCIAGSILQNFCAHSRDELYHLGANEHLSSALQVVMENIMSAEGKHLEVLIGLASHLCYVIPECFVHELGTHTNRAALVKKLVDTLNSNRKPSPEYPRMRKVVVCMAIFTVKWCHGYANIFKEKGMMEALSMVQKTPSKVETYRIFVGNEGVVLERGLPLRDLAARAKEEIDSATSGRPCMISYR
ncbi:hypothetical protein ACP70R_037184 [Stipagrostis hirtigluma subsp. patula]